MIVVAKLQSVVEDIACFYARDVKVVKTNLMSETLKSSVKCVIVMHLKSSDVKCICRVYHFYTRRLSHLAKA